jgi:hypothetical protein
MRYLRGMASKRIENKEGKGRSLVTTQTSQFDNFVAFLFGIATASRVKLVFAIALHCNCHNDFLY